jgi:hypothetical protein
MAELKIDLETLKKWTLDSLGYIEEKKCDALILGGFSGSVIELLGRFMRLHSIKEYSNCFGDFLKEYLPKYFPYKNILYGILRCEGAHAVLAQSGVSLTCAEDMKARHLKGHYDPKMNRKSFIIYSPEFMEDLKMAVEKFFSDVEINPTLEKNCQETFIEIYNEGQKIIDNEEKSGRFKVEYEDEMIRG